MDWDGLGVELLDSSGTEVSRSGSGAVSIGAPGGILQQFADVLAYGARAAIDARYTAQQPAASALPSLSGASPMVRQLVVVGIVAALGFAAYKLVKG